MADEIVIKYKVEVDEFKAEVKGIENNLKSVEKTAEKAANNTSKEFDKAGSAIKNTLAQVSAGIAAAFSIQQVILFGKESIKAFAEAEVNANKLKFAITNIGKEGQVAYQKLIDQSNKLQDISIFSDDDIQKAQTQLATLGLNSKQIEELIPKVLDLASATGQELGSATDTIIQGINGQTRGLRAVGLEFDNTGSKTENLAILTEKLGKFQGSTGDALLTTSGKVKRLENALDNVKETIGEFIVNEGTNLLNFFDSLNKGFSAGSLNSAKGILTDALNKEVDTRLKIAQKSEKDRITQIRASEGRILLLRKESAKATSQADYELISVRLKAEIKLQQELANINKVYSNLLDKPEKSPKVKADKEANKEILNNQKELNEKSIAESQKSFKKKSDDVLANARQTNKDLQQEQDRADAQALSDAQKAAQAEIDLENKKKKAKEESIAFGVSTLELFGQISANISQQRLSEVDAVYSKEQEALQSQLDKGLISRVQYDQKLKELDEKKRKEEAAIRKKQFEQEKAISLIKIAMSTAQGIANALEGDPYTAAYRVAFAAFTGAAQAAIVASQPTPKFAKGGKVEGRLHSQGGTLIEAERDEWIIKRNESIKNDSLLSAINKGKGDKFIYDVYVAPALKEQLKKYSQSKDSSFANNIANSMMLNAGGLKDGNILESLKQSRKLEKENIDRLITVITKNTLNPRNIV